MKNINEIGCKWRFAKNDDYVELDIHQSNFHSGTTEKDSPKFVKVMCRNDGTSYIRYNKETWNLD